MVVNNRQTHLLRIDFYAIIILKQHYTLKKIQLLSFMEAIPHVFVSLIF